MRRIESLINDIVGFVLYIQLTPHFPPHTHTHTYASQNKQTKERSEGDREAVTDREREREKGGRKSDIESVKM